jgi:hypothetical protein
MLRDSSVNGLGLRGRALEDSHTAMPNLAQRGLAFLGFALALGSALTVRSACAAEPILVPDFTPGSPAEFAIAGMLSSQAQDRLLADGEIVLTEEAVQPAVGNALHGCAARAGCPSDVLPHLPARMAVVVMIARTADDNIMGYIRLFVGSDARPLLSRDVPILPGQESLFTDQVSGAVRELLATIGPSSDAVLMAAARLLSGQPLGPSQPSPPRPGEPPDDVALDAPNGPGDPERPPKGTADNRPLDQLLDGSGVYPRHLAGSVMAFRKAALDPRDWVFRNSPHAGRVTVGVQAGLGIGDTERSGDLRATIDAEGHQTEAWYQEGPYYARRSRGGVFVGYAPVTFLDLGCLFGLQYGGRYLTTGLAHEQSDGSTAITLNKAQELQAVQLLFQPRVRGYLIPLGPAKPYLFTGPEFRFFDKYELAQSGSGPLYDPPPGGTVFGYGGGGGLMIDPSPIVGFYAEGSYTQLFGTRAGPVEHGAWSSPHPAPDVPTHHTIGVVGGVQFRI